MKKRKHFKIQQIGFPLLFCALLSSSAPSLQYRGNIYELLQAPNKEALKNIIEKQNKQAFLEQLCQSQKQFSKIPWGCYELQPFSKYNDSFCLKLSVKDLSIESIKKALSIKTLSLRCRKHLSFKLKILNYRKSKKEMETI